MPSFADPLIKEHRKIEERLEAVAEKLASGQVDAALFGELRRTVTMHYLRESQFLAALRRHEPQLAAKIAAQHEEALEIAAQCEESMADGQDSDVRALARRFLAIAQHNIIEEERDVFPLAERCFGTGA